MLFGFSNIILFVGDVQENININKKAEEKDWTKKYIRKHSLFFVSSSDKLIQMNIIDLISRITHKRINEGFIKNINGKKITIEIGSMLYINKKINFQWGMSPTACIAYFIFFITI